VIGIESAEGPARLDQSLHAVAGLRIRADGEDGVRLNGGPMDGRLVLADAPSLSPQWHRTRPPGLAAAHRPGLHLVSGEGTWARWTPP
jgi:hypothetical protein